jgi:hypothetical protein
MIVARLRKAAAASEPSWSRVIRERIGEQGSVTFHLDPASTVFG